MSKPKVPDAVREIASVLTHRLRLESPRFALERAGTRVSGSVISTSFRGLRDAERQRRIWDALEDEYGPGSIQRVGALLAFTPDEWDLDGDHAAGGGSNGRPAGD